MRIRELAAVGAGVGRARAATTCRSLWRQPVRYLWLETRFYCRVVAEPSLHQSDKVFTPGGVERVGREYVIKAPLRHPVLSPVNPTECFHLVSVQASEHVIHAERSQALQNAALARVTATVLRKQHNAAVRRYGFRPGDNATVCGLVLRRVEVTTEYANHI